MKKIILCLLGLFLSHFTFADGIGTWKTYMAYHDVQEIEKAGDRLYVLASDNLYDYNTADNSIRTYDKANTLSDCGIAHIAWCNAAKRLVIVYQNQNIDLLAENGTVTNISDYYNKAMTDDKTIYSLYVKDHHAYLCTGFGILKLNVRDIQIDETYQLGFKTDYCYIENGYLYAASSTNGLYRASLTANLLDKANWSKVGNYANKNKEMNPELLAMVKTLDPGGPKYNHFSCLRFHNGKLYTVGGGYTVMQDLYRPGCIQVLAEDEWQIYEDDIQNKIGGNYFYDINSVDINPKDESQVFASGKTGLFEFKNQKFVKHYSYDNSPLVSTFDTNKNYVVVHSVKFDKEGTLWCANSINNKQNLLSLSPDYKWTTYFKTNLQSLTNLTSLTFDSRNLLWIANNSWKNTSLFCYQPSTDAINPYTTFINQDGLKVEAGYVRCVCEDKKGNMWIGTAAGPLVLEPSEITGDTPIFQQVKVPRNDGTNYADYLLSGIDITCIAIDGGNRKWFGTNNNGLYLISSDNMTQIAHFMANNSPLLSNNIESLTINPDTGELYIGTDKGLCSYKSDASEPVEEMNSDVTYAYPNPVRPDYTGPITITGLTLDADVKITTSNGILVAQGRSNGGTFVWDGTDTKGKRVASGIYMVQTATSEGDKGTVCKIAVVN